MSGPRNTLTDLNNHLFEQLERLNDEFDNDEDLKKEVERAKAVEGVAKTIIETGKLVLDGQRFKHDDRMDADRKLPRMLSGE